VCIFQVEIIGYLRLLSFLMFPGAVVIVFWAFLSTCWGVLRTLQGCETAVNIVAAREKGFEMVSLLMLPDVLAVFCRHFQVEEC
jgi:hypothetical protein